MARLGSVDFSDIEQLAERFQRALDTRVIERWIREFLLNIAFATQRKIKKRTPVNTGLLRDMWTVGNVQKRGDTYIVEITNALEYAVYVEYGFRSHFVHGRWEGNVFVYDPSERSGMYVGEKNGWVDGKFMMRISFQETERTFASYIERRQATLLNQIMNGR